MTSLRRRAITGSLAWTSMSILVCGLLLVQLFASVANTRFEEKLIERHFQVVNALGYGGVRAEDFDRVLVNPEFDRAYSGEYWQVDGPDGVLLTSRSLFDAQLPRPGTNPSGPSFWSGEVAGSAVRGLREVITLEDGSQYLVTVACSLEDLIAEKRTTRKNLAIAVAVLALFNIASAVTQVTTMLRPLSKMRKDLSDRDSEAAILEAHDYPEEVAPLVNDINVLLKRNRDIVARGRRQAADLAHALKTPSAALRNELMEIGQRPSAPARALEALDRIDAQIGRSLARMRASNSASMAGGLQTDLDASLDRLSRLFCSMSKKAGRAFNVQTGGGCTVFVDQNDLEEILGNLLENALKWSRSRISLSTRHFGGFVEVTIEDDGPGIPPERRTLALEAGARLDTAVHGTGLGLAISHDLIQAYGGKLDLRESEDLGGLMVVVKIPRKRDTAVGKAIDQAPQLVSA